MKKKLEAELISIAHRILKLKNKSTLPQLQEETRQLYEKLTILNFTETHFAGPQPTIGQIKNVLDTEESNEPKLLDQETSKEVKEVPQKVKEVIDPTPPTSIKEKEEEKPKQTNVPPIDSDPIEKSAINKDSKPEIIIEEINARVTEDLFVPANTVEKPTSFTESILSQSVYEKNDKDDITPTNQDIAIQNIENDNRPKSLNDQLRREIHIGLNDRLAFIKYLFEGSSSDYNRVLSQLNTLRSKNEAKEFITTMIKPDYHNWDGKEEYEERFMGIVLGKFED
ncbi:hypothetical protein [Aquimarina aquimarini]|uniref:hypothetical protein n=1 Tax=Aquimarina aquimarini TaxID=1191734 RepID=UPI000D552652|nr:hypothetical protein [Aquimarina aquimarini]